MVVACGALGDVQMGGEVMSKKFHDLIRGGHSAEGGEAVQSDNTCVLQLAIHGTRTLISTQLTMMIA